LQSRGGGSNRLVFGDSGADTLPLEIKQHRDDAELACPPSDIAKPTMRPFVSHSQRACDACRLSRTEASTVALRNAMAATICGKLYHGISSKATVRREQSDVNAAA
jgi:hypothetical protein